MSTLSPTLLERARRHGLEREEVPGRVGWSLSGDTFYFVGTADAGYWWWAPANVDPRQIERGPRYATEEAALTAALHYLDHTVPGRAWSPSVGGQLAEAVGELNFVCGMLRACKGESLKILGEDLSRAIEKVAALALPSGADEGAALAVAWDYSLSRGGLSEHAREAVVRAVRHCPEVVEAAKLAVWGPQPDERDDFVLTSVSASPEVLGHAWRMGDRWLWCAGVTDPEGNGEAETAEAAREVCARALPDWRILPGATVAAPETVTETDDEEGHAWTGTWLEVCTNYGCQGRGRARWRRGGWHVTAADSDEATRLLNQADSVRTAGQCEGREARQENYREDARELLRAEALGLLHRGTEPTVDTLTTHLMRPLTGAELGWLAEVFAEYGHLCATCEGEGSVDRGSGPDTCRGCGGQGRAP